MKIAILTDTHCGVRNNSQFFIDKQTEFYEKLFWPVVDRLNVEMILHLGDYFDSPKSISPLSVYHNQMSFVREAVKRSLPVHLIPGNHDVFFRHMNTVCSTQLILGNQPQFYVHMEPVILFAGTSRILMVPWITHDNRDICMNAIQKNNEYDWCFGHFEVSGYKMYKGSQVCKTGMSASDFPDIHKVRSGHFHEPNGIYLGANMEYTWADSGCVRGFNVLDTNTSKFIYIPNRKPVFREIIYDPDANMPIGSVENMYVRLVSGDVKDEAHYEAFRQAIIDGNPHDLEIVAHHPVYLPVTTNSIDETLTMDDNFTLLTQRIDSSDVPIRPEVRSRVDDFLNRMKTECA